MSDPSTQTHFATLDSFRGIAALMVVWFHSTMINQTRPVLVAPGNLYVDFFFILSGFVLAHAYLKRIDQGFGFWRFIWVRLARIWPLHLFMLLVFLAYNTTQMTLEHLGLNVDPNPQNTGLAFWCNLLLIHAMGFLHGLSWNYPSWSISVEFWTYVIFFLFAAAIPKHRARFAFLISVTGFVLLIVLSVRMQKDTLLASYDFGIIRCVGGFFAGVLIHQLRDPKTPVYTGARATAAEISVILWTALMLSRADGSKLFELGSILGFCLVIAVFCRTDGRISQILKRPFPQFLGRISYSIYMIHALILSLCGFTLRSLLDLSFSINDAGQRIVDTQWATPINLCQMALVVWAASYTYRWVERPCQTYMAQMRIRRAHSALEP